MKLEEFLREHASSLDKTERYQRLARWGAYMRGMQYAGRRLDIHGYLKGSPGVFPFSSRVPGWGERDIPCVWNLWDEIVKNLTAWSVGGDNWCRLEVAEDEAAEDWLGVVATTGDLGDIIARARNWGGGVGTAVVAFSVRNGVFHFEALNPTTCWPLEWADEVMHRPAAVARVYEGEAQFAKSASERPLLCRYWDAKSETSPGVEQLWERYRTPIGEWKWRKTAEVVHGLPFCPVYWHPNGEPEGRHDGDPDLCGAEGEVDEANELFAAAGITTKRNADDTLVVHTDPSDKPAGRIRKGGFNVIYSKGGADYLSQDGASATICVDLAERRARHCYQKAGLDRIDIETLSRATSGETLKRLFHKTVATAATTRTSYARGLITPICRDVLEASRIILSRRTGKFMYPPRILPGADPKMTGIRTPGRSSFVECVWPTPFPPTQDDKQKAVTSASAGVTGGVLSKRTALVMQEQAGVPIGNVDQELAAIEEDANAAAEKAQAMMGLEPPGTGRAGPIPGGGGPANDGKPDDAGDAGDSGKSAAE